MNAPDALPDDVAALRAALESRTEEVEALRAEIEETNRGVVALYSELDMQAEQLRQATELKSRFLAYMSHEFRTPIVAIQSITRLLMDRVDGPLTPEQEKQVGFVRDTAAEFSEMVNDLLDLARLEAGRVEVSPAWFDMVAMFDALRGMFKPVLTNPEVSLIFEEPHDVQKLFSDDRKVSHILRNYISNALKFTPSGEVRVSATCGSPDTITFSVRDTGIGIPPDSHGEVFQAAAAALPRLGTGPGAVQAAGRVAGRSCRLRKRSGRGIALLRDAADHAAQCAAAVATAAAGGHARLRRRPCRMKSAASPSLPPRTRWCWWWTTTRSRATPPSGC